MLGDALLDRGKALDCMDNARELDQRAVTHQLGDAAVMLGGSIRSFRSSFRRAGVPASSVAIGSRLMAKLCPSEPGLTATGIRLRPDVQPRFDRCRPYSGPATGSPR